MSRRNAVGKARGGADGGGGGRGGGAIQAASAEMDSLRAELLSSLTSVITDTVDMVCEQHEENFTQAVHQLQNGGGGGGGAYASRPSSSSKHASASANGNGADTADYDLFHQCCQRLVRYIDANMTTSPDFAQQMDRVILACHSNASETVLASVVTKKLWLHTKSSVANTDEDDDTREDDDVEDFVELRAKPSRGRAAAVKPELPTARSAKRRVSAPLPPPPPPSSRSAKVKSPVKKRARRESSSRKTKYAPSDDESEEEEEVEASPRKRKRRVARLRYSEEEDNAEQQQEDEEDDDDDDVVLVNKDVAKQPHYGQADELLTFKDAIGDMCYADRRTPAQTRFFKDRLRKAIQFVDAQLCKPPKGKSCSWECAKIRRQMCNRDLPCRNKICRLWHDVEAHTDRCQNTHCEFRIRVMLRETMYKIDHKKMEVQNFRNELHTKKKELVDLKNEGVSDRDNFVERRLLENEIDQLESEIENAEKDLGIFKATRKTYWATLNEIGITVEDDENDQFPNFKAHYAEKKAAAKKKTPIKARASDDYTTSSTPTKSSRSERSRRRQSIDTPDQAASPLQKRERIARRSTQQSLKVLSNGVIELDDDEEDGRNEDEEAKTDRSADEDNAVRPSHDSVDERNGTREDDEQHQEDEGDANQRVPRSADGVEDASAETEAHDEADAPPSTGGTVDETQSADYVIESEETQPEGSTSGMASALEAFNQVVDAHSKPSEADGDASDSGDKAPQTTATTEDENAPLLPF